MKHYMMQIVSMGAGSEIVMGWNTHKSKGVLNPPITLALLREDGDGQDGEDEY